METAMICPACGEYLLMDGDHTERDCWEVQARQEYEDPDSEQSHDDEDNTIEF